MSEVEEAAISGRIMKLPRRSSLERQKLITMVMDEVRKADTAWLQLSFPSSLTHTIRLHETATTTLHITIGTLRRLAPHMSYISAPSRLLSLEALELWKGSSIGDTEMLGGLASIFAVEIAKLDIEAFPRHICRKSRVWLIQQLVSAQRLFRDQTQC